MRFANAIQIHRKFGGAKPRDLQFSFSASAAHESETADPSASLGMTKRREWLRGECG
jgi:hypothetical protein